MEPLSAIAGISTVCVRGAKVLVGYFEYIEEIRDVPQHVDQLTSEFLLLMLGCSS
jgi:hypothetical protein